TCSLGETEALIKVAFDIAILSVTQRPTNEFGIVCCIELRCLLVGSILISQFHRDRHGCCGAGSGSGSWVLCCFNEFSDQVWCRVGAGNSQIVVMSTQTRVHLEKIWLARMLMDFNVEHAEAVPVQCFHELSTLGFKCWISCCQKSPGVSFQPRRMIVYDDLGEAGQGIIA